MKKLIQILMIEALLAGCASLPEIRLPLLGSTATPVPVTVTPTSPPSETPAPTQNLFATSTSTPLTFTPTVTAIGAELFTPTGTATLFATAARTAQPLATQGLPSPGLPPGVISGTYFTPQHTGFLAILASSNTMYWNEGPCSPRNIRITAFVEDTVNTKNVYLFTRLREKRNTLNVTRWNAGALMVEGENGSFNYNIRTFNLRRYYYFREAWLEYQLVALDENKNETGRTPIYDRNLSLVRCQPVQ